jgi:hypothetical protein
LALLACAAIAAPSSAQVDHAKEELLELGYDHALSGAGPTAGYLFYYLNLPDARREGSALRLAIAPVYVDGEYGIGRALGPATDLGLGLAGGGFAQDHAEVRLGQYLRRESFDGHGGAASASVYHLFDPGRMIPLSGVLRESVQYSDFARAADTAAGFTLPPDHATFVTRAGLRFGGERPTLPPSDALEVSTWYEGRFRDRAGDFGLAGDRRLQRASHFLWLKTVFVRVMPGTGRRVGLGLSAGTSVDADRLNGYGLGGGLPLTLDFPRDIPGYYNQELAARRFVLVSGQFGLPLDRERRFLVNVFGAAARVSYVPGLEQAGATNSGAGIGLQYDSPSHAWNALIDYGYGFDAIRSGTRGAHSISLTLQYDLLAGRRAAAPARVAPLPVFKR